MNIFMFEKVTITAIGPSLGFSKIVYVYNRALIDNSTFVAVKATLYK